MGAHINTVYIFYAELRSHKKGKKQTTVGIEFSRESIHTTCCFTHKHLQSQRFTISAKTFDSLGYFNLENRDIATCNKRENLIMNS